MQTFTSSLVERLVAKYGGRSWRQITEKLSAIAAVGAGSLVTWAAQVADIEAAYGSYSFRFTLEVNHLKIALNCIRNLRLLPE